ncbi:hypothetical protein GBW32_14765 [Streptomyces tsukubensis]|nr:hypothetical protein GBW32_14765 [Streptomyces tsukubensis]
MTGRGGCVGGHRCPCCPSSGRAGCWSRAGATIGAASWRTGRGVMNLSPWGTAPQRRLRLPHSAAARRVALPSVRRDVCAVTLVTPRNPLRSVKETLTVR